MNPKRFIRPGVVAAQRAADGVARIRVEWETGQTDLDVSAAWLRRGFKHDVDGASEAEILDRTSELVGRYVAAANPTGDMAFGIGNGRQHDIAAGSKAVDAVTPQSIPVAVTRPPPLPDC